MLVYCKRNSASLEIKINFVSLMQMQCRLVLKTLIKTNPTVSCCQFLFYKPFAFYWEYESMITSSITYFFHRSYIMLSF